MINKKNMIDIDKLVMGEPVKCPDCGEGIFVPFDESLNLPLNKCYWFKCNKCGSTLHLSPAWEADLIK